MRHALSRPQVGLMTSFCGFPKVGSNFLPLGTNSAGVMLTEFGIMVQPVPIAIEDWLNPAAFPRPGFPRNVVREGIVL
jgi:hypothetical protein